MLSYKKPWFNLPWTTCLTLSRRACSAIHDLRFWSFILQKRHHDYDHDHDQGHDHHHENHHENHRHRYHHYRHNYYHYFYHHQIRCNVILPWVPLLIQSLLYAYHHYQHYYHIKSRGSTYHDRHAWHFLARVYSAVQVPQFRSFILQNVHIFIIIITLIMIIMIIMILLLIIIIIIITIIVVIDVIIIITIVVIIIITNTIINIIIVIITTNSDVIWFCIGCLS